MKTKVFLTLLTTVLVLFVLRPFFTLYEPMEVKINVQGKGREKITLSFTEKQYQSFDNVPVLYAHANLKHDQNVVFRFTATGIESLRLKTEKNIAIKNVTVIGQTTVSAKPSKSLQLSRINVKAKSTIQYSLAFICFAVLSAVFFHLFTCLEKLNIPGKRSLPDICFLAVFCLILLIPATKISTDKVSRWENKKLAQYKPLMGKQRLNTSFGKNFEEWFNDRFFMREKIIRFYGKLESHLKNNENGPVLIGKNNWLFLNSKEDISDFQNNMPFTKRDLKRIIAYLKDVDAWTRKNGKHFYIIFAPDKHRIYDEFYPPFIQKKKPDSENPLSQIIRELEKTDIRFIFPVQELKNHKPDRLLYWKTDTHWNEYGSYIAYRALMNLMAKDDPSLAPKKYVFNTPYAKGNGDLTRLLPSDSGYNTTTVYDGHGYLFKTPHFATGVNPKSRSKDYVRKNPDLPHAPKVIALMDSFFIGLSPYLGEHFSEIREIWQRNVTPEIQADMKDADILLLEIRAGIAYLLKRATFHDEK